MLCTGNILLDPSVYGVPLRITLSCTGSQMVSAALPGPLKKKKEQSELRRGITHTGA